MRKKAKSDAPPNMGVPDDESASLDQDVFDLDMEGKSDEELEAMLARIVAAPPADQEPDHEETAAAALAELIAESEDGGPPEWFRKAYENT